MTVRFLTTSLKWRTKTAKEYLKDYISVCASPSDGCIFVIQTASTNIGIKFVEMFVFIDQSSDTNTNKWFLSILMVT